MMKKISHVLLKLYRIRGGLSKFKGGRLDGVRVLGIDALFLLIGLLVVLD